MSDPTDATTPLDTNFAKVAAEHLRDLKAYIQTLVANPVTIGFARVHGADCKNNATTPNTKFDLDANAIILVKPSTKQVKSVIEPAVVTCDLTVTGPAINARDQAGAFAANSWIRFYWIYNSTTSTLASIASLAAPSVGPALPSGYDFWAYAGAVRFDAGSALLKTRIKGAKIFYEDRKAVLTNGVSTSEAAVDVSGFVPPEALSFKAAFEAENISDTTAGRTVSIKYITGSTFHAMTVKNPAGTFLERQAPSIDIPNVGQQFIYSWSSGAGTVELDAYIQGYTVPNGGE